jgi:hypothetical protein
LSWCAGDDSTHAGPSPFLETGHAPPLWFASVPLQSQGPNVPHRADLEVCGLLPRSRPYFCSISYIVWPHSRHLGHRHRCRSRLDQRTPEAPDLGAERLAVRARNGRRSVTAGVTGQRRLQCFSRQQRQRVASMASPHVWALRICVRLWAAPPAYLPACRGAKDFLAANSKTSPCALD